ncbi:MAG TPA: hypothetical protein VGX52_10680 [Burkholderiales bacterium]|nr:hypothetical protein [Burkholderiales bacterium]
MPRIIRIVFSPQDEWRQIARERSHAALLYTFMMVGAQQLLGVPENDAAQFVAIALVLAIVGSTLGGGAAGALGLL